MLADKQRKVRIWTLLGAFFLPCLLAAAVFACIGIYPFGEKSLLIIDMNSEYVDYLAQMNESVRTGGSLLRSWNMGMGLNMLGLIAFYTASPFNLLVLLFPVSAITEVLFAVTLMKIGLAGLLFARYAAYVFGRRGWFAVCFSTAYALCAYNVAYASNIMWLDGAAFLPLVLLGVERLLRENRRGTLLFSLIYVFFSSYYIGYMIGVFSLLYLTAVWFSQPRSLREYSGKVLWLVGTAALAAGCCAALLLPAFWNLRHGQTEMFLLDLSPELQKSFVHILARMLPGVYETLTDSGYPNVYCTVLGLLLGCVYFTNKWIPRRQKLVFGGLLAFLLFSFSCRAVYLAWHAFEDPTWFPARYSFVFSFWVLYLAMHAAEQLNRLPVCGMAGAVGLLLLLIVEIGIGRHSSVRMASLLAGGALLLLYSGAWLLGRHRQYRWLGPLTLLLVCAEAGGNMLAMEWGLDREFQYRSRQSYTAYREQYEPILQEIARRDSGIYRVEIAEQRNANGGMALGYNGISHYSTTTDQALNAFLRRLGYNRGTENELRFARTTPLTNGLLGIKYVLSKQPLESGYELRYTHGEIGVYENTCAFPLAFWADAQALGFAGGAENPFALQNEWMDALAAGNSFFTPVADVTYRLQNLDREWLAEDAHLLLSRRVQDEPAYVRYEVHNPTGQEVYAFFPVWQRRFSQAEIRVDAMPVQPDLRYRRNTIAPMGDARDIELVLNLQQSAARIAGEHFYRLDVDAAAKAAGVAWESPVAFDRFTDTAVTGTLTAPRDGVLVTTFPYDTGWSIRLDGRKTQAQAFAGVFLAIPVSGGEHSLAMHYRPPGFVAGCWISAACLTGIAATGLYRKKNRATPIERADNP